MLLYSKFVTINGNYVMFYTSKEIIFEKTFITK